MIDIDVVANELHQTAINKGFWEPLFRSRREDHFIFYCKQLAMVHSEVTEVLEALRKDKGQEAIVEELADIIIRVLDLYAGLKEDAVISDSLEEVLIRKSHHNKTRDRLHGVAG